jgi:hypothetical protein
VAGEASFDAIFQLTWPDSEALLQSLLGTDFDALQPPGGMFPSQLILNEQQLNTEPTSPWLNQEDRENSDHSGNQAIRNLTKIITTLVRGISSPPLPCYLDVSEDVANFR